MFITRNDVRESTVFCCPITLIIWEGIKVEEPSCRYPGQVWDTNPWLSTVTPDRSGIPTHGSLPLPRTGLGHQPMALCHYPGQVWDTNPWLSACKSSSQTPKTWLFLSQTVLVSKITSWDVTYPHFLSPRICYADSDWNISDSPVSSPL